MQILEPFPKSTSSGSEAGTIALQKPFKVTLQQAQGQELLPNAITNMLCGCYKLQGTLEYIQNVFFLDTNSTLRELCVRLGEESVTP
jgi:hypothetical protein